MNSLQGEFDTLASTLKQLTNQKDVAQKRLDELDVQVTKKMITVSPRIGRTSVPKKSHPI